MNLPEHEQATLKKLLLGDMTRHKEGRIILVCLCAILFFGMFGLPRLWEEIEKSSRENSVLRALLIREDSLRNYLASPTASDLERCRSDVCSLETLPASGKAAISFSTALSLPPTQRYFAPAGRVFVDLSMSQTVPFLEQNRAEQSRRTLAQTVPLGTPIPPKKPIGVRNMHWKAPHKEGSEAFEVDSPGIVSAVQPENQGLPILLLRGNLQAWADYCDQHGDPDELRFSMIEFQPVPTEWRFAAPDSTAGILNVGDPLILDFDPQATDDWSVNNRLRGTIASIERAAEKILLSVTPDNATASNWLASRIATELVWIQRQQQRPALPDRIRVTAQPAFQRSGNRPATIQVPVSALRPLNDSHATRSQLWIIVDGFLVPVEINRLASWGEDALIEEVPLLGDLPISDRTWGELSHWQRSRLLAFSKKGSSRLLADRTHVIVLHPQPNFRAGLPARSRSTVVTGS